MLVPLVGIPKENVKRVAKFSRFTLRKPEADVEQLLVVGSVVDTHAKPILLYSTSRLTDVPNPRLRRTPNEPQRQVQFPSRAIDRPHLGQPGRRSNQFVKRRILTSLSVGDRDQEVGLSPGPVFRNDP